MLKIAEGNAEMWGMTKMTTASRERTLLCAKEDRPKWAKNPLFKEWDFSRLKKTTKKFTSLWGRLSGGGRDIWRSSSNGGPDGGGAWGREWAECDRLWTGDIADLVDR